MSIPDCLGSVQAGPSPFGRLVAFHVYDGPVSGLIECTSTGEFFLFRLLAWDERQHDRVFSLAPLNGESARRLIADLAEFDDPNWPQWWLNARGSDEKEHAMDRLIDEAWRNAGAVCCVIITSALLKEVKGSVLVTADNERRAFEELDKRTPPDSELTDAPFEAWQRFVDSGSGHPTSST